VQFIWRLTQARIAQMTRWRGKPFIPVPTIMRRDTGIAPTSAWPNISSTNKLSFSSTVEEFPFTFPLNQELTAGLCVSICKPQKPQKPPYEDSLWGSAMMSNVPIWS